MPGKQESRRPDRHPESRVTDPEVSGIVDFVRDALSEAADPSKASAMAAYMKTDMPFYGVQKKARDDIARQMKLAFPILDPVRYESSILALWDQTHREEKYLAIALATAWPAFITRDAMPLYERLIREGAWWDFVDDVAIRLSGKVWAEDRRWTEARMDAWIEDESLWIRRAAIIGQIKHKAKTDSQRLFGYCLRCAPETEFFIRKAIGWALREHSKTDPAAIRAFLTEHRDRLSGLSYREGAKRLVKQGLL